MPAKTATCSSPWGILQDRLQAQWADRGLPGLGWRVHGPQGAAWGLRECQVTWPQWPLHSALGHGGLNSHKHTVLHNPAPLAHLCSCWPGPSQTLVIGKGHTRDRHQWCLCPRNRVQGHAGRGGAEGHPWGEASQKGDRAGWGRPQTLATTRRKCGDPRGQPWAETRTAPLPRAPHKAVTRHLGTST